MEVNYRDLHPSLSSPLDELFEPGAKMRSSAATWVEAIDKRVRALERYVETHWAVLAFSGKDVSKLSATGLALIDARGEVSFAREILSQMGCNVAPDSQEPLLDESAAEAIYTTDGAFCAGVNLMRAYQELEYAVCEARKKQKAMDQREIRIQAYIDLRKEKENPSNDELVAALSRFGVEFIKKKKGGFDAAYDKYPNGIEVTSDSDYQWFKRNKKELEGIYFQLFEKGNSTR
jgi:hypothetical protein